MMHLKGRRHRLAYKKKVDPSLDVDVKPTFKGRRTSDEKNRRDLMRMRQQELWSMRAMYANQSMAGLGPGANAGPPLAPFGPVIPHLGPRGETPDDTYVMIKHGQIYPTEDELNTVQALVINCEKALKAISDIIHREWVAVYSSITFHLAVHSTRRTSRVWATRRWSARRGPIARTSSARSRASCASACSPRGCCSRVTARSTWSCCARRSRVVHCCTESRRRCPTS